MLVARGAIRYNCIMIKSWKHKGLKRFYLTGSKAGINPDHAKRLTIILQLLDTAEEPNDLNLPGFYLHALTGKFEWGYHSIRVSGNWRVIFELKEKMQF